jgi:hypothetical protein
LDEKGLLERFLNGTLCYWFWQRASRKDLQELLKDENRLLAIHITFDSNTTFHHEYEKADAFSCGRRILAGCMGMSWDARPLKLLGSEHR